MVLFAQNFTKNIRNNIFYHQFLSLKKKLYFTFNYTSLKNEKNYSKVNGHNVSMYSLKISDNEILCEKILFSKYNLSHFLRVAFSDLRLIDSYNNEHNPVILIRKNMILLRTGFISCIIRFNELWMFDSSNYLVIKAKNFIKDYFIKRYNLKLKEKNMNEKNINEKNIIEKNKNEKNILENLLINEMDNTKKNLIDKNKNFKDLFFYKYNTNSKYFEFICLDICMQLSLKAYENDINKMNEEISKKILLHKKEEETDETNILTNKTLIDMMKIKNNLQKLLNLLNPLRCSIEKILKDDNDLNNMYLTLLNSKESIKDHTELEILLETHLQLTDELCQSLKNIDEKITHYEELMRLNLDYNRNKLILLNVKISYFTLSCAISSIITSLFGMNLKNYIELSHYAFFVVSSFIFFFFILAFYSSKNIKPLLKIFDKKNIKSVK